MLERNKSWAKIVTVSMLVVFFAGISALFYWSSPEALVSFVGVENSYVLMFVLAFIGGLSAFSGVPFHWILAALAAGGLNPWLLGFATAFGVMLGDSTSYFIGFKGREIIPVKIQNFLEKIFNYGYRHPRILPWIFFLYGSLSPFSNDFIVISSGLAKYPFWKVMIPLGLGNIVFNVGVALLAAYGYAVFS